MTPEVAGITPEVDGITLIFSLAMHSAPNVIKLNPEHLLLLSYHSLGMGTGDHDVLLRLFIGVCLSGRLS